MNTHIWTTVAFDKTSWNFEDEQFWRRHRRCSCASRDANRPRFSRRKASCKNKQASWKLAVQEGKQYKGLQLVSCQFRKRRLAVWLLASGPFRPSGPGCFSPATGFFDRSCYTEKLLHTEAFSHRSFFTRKLLHRDASTQRNFFTLSYELLNTEAVLYTHTHTYVLTHRSLYTESFITRKLSHTAVSSQRSLYAERLSHTGTFTHTVEMFSHNWNTIGQIWLVHWYTVMIPYNRKKQWFLTRQAAKKHGNSQYRPHHAPRDASGVLVPVLLGVYCFESMVPCHLHGIDMNKNQGQPFSRPSEIMRSWGSMGVPQ